MPQCPSCADMVPSSEAACLRCGATLAFETPTRTGLAAPSTWRPGEPAGDGRFPPGTLLAGRYRIAGQLGRGGMGEVYRADDLKLGQPVALKFLPPALARDAAWLARFHNEVRIARGITHPNVCRVHDIGEADGQHFLAMELVDGEDLASLLRRIGRLPVDKAIEIARELCAALATAHARGVLHRDLKPANVLLDAQGHVRLADFGLAALTSDAGAAELAGTPAYMAPEQLVGRPATVKSDLYALGLVLHETFTGRRLFDARSLPELLEQHRVTRAPSLSSAVRDMPPALERAILRCLEADPEARPPSALAVLATLPGGDPLQAALAAGETPSPAMVAAAGAVGDLRPPAAWAGLAIVMAAVLLLPWMMPRLNLALRVPLPLPPEALEVRAREVVERLGPRPAPVDRASGFAWDAEAVRDVLAGHGGEPEAWRAAAEGRPSPVFFHYRQGTARMVARSEDARVTPREPPLDEPGMVAVGLEPDGRLRLFTAIPPPLPEGAPAAVDWSPALREAGLDPAALRSVAPRRAAPVDTDHKQAWEGSDPRWPGRALRIEAGSLRGSPVWFAVFDPSRVEVAARAPSPARATAGLLFVVFLASAQVGAALLAWRNVRNGRGDLRGAWRVAMGVFAAYLVSGLLRADHVLSVAEYDVVSRINAFSLYNAVLVGLGYLAVEPYARRRWPHMLISWNRLLQGRWRDPMVGRDVLTGMVAAMVAAGAAVLVGDVLPRALGATPLAPRALPLTPYSELRHLLFFLVRNLSFAVVQALFTVCGLLLVSVVLRREWVSRVVVGIFVASYGFATFGQESVLAGVIAGGMALVVLPLLFTRGLLCLAGFAYTALVLEVVPATLDFSSWYAGRGVLAGAWLLALAVAAFLVALGGRSPFGERFLED